MGSGSSDVALQHLGIRSVVALEYAMKDGKWRLPGMKEKRKALVMEWFYKFNSSNPDPSLLTII